MDGMHSRLEHPHQVDVAVWLGLAPKPWPHFEHDSQLDCLSFTGSHHNENACSRRHVDAAAVMKERHPDILK